MAPRADWHTFTPSNEPAIQIQKIPAFQTIKHKKISPPTHKTKDKPFSASHKRKKYPFQMSHRDENKSISLADNRQKVSKWEQRPKSPQHKRTKGQSQKKPAF